MKWDEDFIKKLHDIREHQDNGRMYDKKRVDKHLFGFCENDPDSKYDNEIIKLLRLKYALKRKDIMPFVEILEKDQQTDLFKLSDKEL